MKNGGKKRFLFPMVLALVCSLAVAPVSADGSAKTPITITVEDDVRGYQQDSPAAWSCRVTAGALAEGDSIEDLVNGPPVCAANRNSAVGEYPITLAKKEGTGYDVTIENGTLTIEPAVLTSLDPDEPTIHYITIYASDPANRSAEELKTLVAARAGAYTARCGSGTVQLKPNWTADSTGAPYDFDPKGKVENIWYPYTAALTTARDADAKNFRIDIDSPRAYVRVIPVNAAQTLTPSTATLTAAAVEALTNEEGVKGILDLPKTAGVTYLPHEAPLPYKGEANGQYAITGWNMDNGQKFTLEALRAIAAGVADGQEAEVTLTPVYADAGNKAVPAWATLEETPTFTLIITGKTPMDAAVRAPASITYGEALGDPVLEPELDPADGTVTYRYEGVDGTRYNSADKPTAAGTYRVAASLTGAGHSGSWTSEKFSILPKAVTVSGITGTSREYDGSTNANAALNTSEAVVSGMVEGDDLHVTASGFFLNKNAASNKTVVLINLALTGEDAGNYTLAASGNQTRTTAGITPKPLEIDDSEITVSKQYDGTKRPGTLEGRLKLRGVIDSEVGLSEVTVGPYGDSAPGENKAVTLSGLELTGAGSAVYNYSLPSSYTFTEAEITAKPRPVLNTDFTVTLPSAAYDGRPHAAAVEAKDAGLGAAVLTYARRNADGTYDAPTGEEPVNAGTYKVIVSFEEGAGFAAMRGRNAIDAGTLTIRKASAAAAATITVPVTATERKIPLTALDLPDGMAQGLRIKEAPSAGGDVLRRVTGEVGGTAFTLKTKTVKSDKTQDFQLVLRSDNYVRLTVTVTVAASGASLEITPPVVTVKREVSTYGTPPEDILSLEGGSAALNGTRVPGTFTLPAAPYDAGRYTDIQVLFHSGDGNYQNFPVTVHAAFTIEKAAVTSLSPDEPLTRYITIYANNPSNGSAEGLKNLVAASAGTYTARYGGGTVELRANWRADSAAGPYRFNPKGKAENIWYPYTATLTTAEDAAAQNFLIGVDHPTAYVRVIPVYARQTLAPSAASLPASAVKGLTNETLYAALGLPEKADVTYRPMEDLSSPAFEEASGTYAIRGWKMNGKPLTLKALRAKAAAASGREVEVTLTPVYANDAVPPWATVTDAPVFRLTLTGRTPEA